MKTVTERRKFRVFRCWPCACLIWVGWMSALAAQPAPPASVPASPPAESWETQSVRELMQQDLREALRESSPAPAGRAPDRPARPLLAPRLVALYGVGQALMAEIQVGQRAYLYVRGQAFPAGHAGDPGVYQLRGMNGACVQLERGEDRHSLCLRMLLGGDPP
ncbi:hypothetical protein [uncultured Castellaniella sp.]|uniref:hypothetical protein n=1 Tax=uncultured Castellaniella sp. TaxID=647907 RepID=UPI00262AF37B|nr:hypothetical protein [uncultured Castellaniella sp.]